MIEEQWSRLTNKLVVDNWSSKTNDAVGNELRKWSVHSSRLACSLGFLLRGRHEHISSTHPRPLISFHRGIFVDALKRRTSIDWSDEAHTSPSMGSPIATATKSPVKVGSTAGNTSTTKMLHFATHIREAIVGAKL
jgi:hypothetical protein